MRNRRRAPLVAAGAVLLVAVLSAVAGPVRIGEPIIPLHEFNLFDLLDNEAGEDDELELDDEWWEQVDLGALSIGAVIVALVFGAAMIAAVLVALRALIGALFGLSMPSLTRRSRDEDPAVRVTHALHEAADLAAYEAAAAPPGRASDAVVVCWVLLEEAAATAGTPRGAPQTPTEFTVALLTEHRADRTAVDTLLGLYHEARFGTRPLPDQAAEEAAWALRRISASLSADVQPAGEGTEP